MRKTVVITGANGFIGSNLTRYMATKGYTVYAVILPDSPTRKRIEELPFVHIIEGDLKEYDRLAERIPKGSEALLHFAWSGVAPECRASLEYQRVNLDLALDAVRLAAAVKTKRFIFPGSTMEYADCGEKIGRSAFPSPHNAYGATKIAARYFCETLCKQLDIPYIYVVIAGIYAADRTDNNVICYTITKLLNREKPSLTKLEQLWDYVYIDDVVDALYLVVDKGRGGAFYTIGHGDNWALSNYIYMIRDIIDPELPLGIGDIGYGSEKIPTSCVDLQELYADTGFVPKVPFETGIKKVIETMREKVGG